MVHEVEAAELSIDSVGEYLPGEGGEGDAVAAVAAGGEDVAIQPIEVGHAVHGDGERATPAIVDARVGKLWVYL